jgi:muramidase (phage lysozyme)
MWTGGQRYPMPTLNSGHPGKNSNRQSAAGIFQMLEGIFNDMQKRVGPMDFQEPDQHLAATAYLDNIGALEPLRNGDVDGFLNEASQTDGWASLPGGEQPRGITRDQAKALYEQFLRSRMGRQ